MFQTVSLNRLQESNNYRHLDVTVSSIVGQNKIPSLRFKFYQFSEDFGIEFRFFPDWPIIICSEAAKNQDAYGNYIRISIMNMLSIKNLTKFELQCLQDIANDLPAIIHSATRFCESVKDPEILIEGAKGLANVIIASTATNGDTISFKSSIDKENAETTTKQQSKIFHRAETNTTKLKLAEKLPDYVEKVISEFNAVSLDCILRSSRPMPDCNNPVVIAVVKNELDRLNDFLLHYRSKGIERFVFIDNGSTDGTLEFLRFQPDVDIYIKLGKFDWMLKQGWINKIISMYGYDRWYMYLDADEHITFYKDTIWTFRDLTVLMDSCNIFRVRGLLVDMYSDVPLLKTEYKAHSPLKPAYPYFDKGTYKEERYSQIMSVKGGPRTRVFGKVDPKFKPEMTKYPLFKLNPGEYMANPHHIWPYEGNYDSPRLLAILHYKFLPGIIEKIRNAIEEKNYWDGSFEYQCYLKALDNDPLLSLVFENSKFYENYQSLIDAEVIDEIAWPNSDCLSRGARVAYLRRKAEIDCAKSLTAFRTAAVSIQTNDNSTI